MSKGKKFKRGGLHQMEIPTLEAEKLYESTKL
jgi:hypothetical protein